MNKSTILKGAFILTLANIFTRVIGFFYRIYMNNTIGIEGMGLYQLILPIYSLCWSITSAGFTTTISKLTAQEKAKNEYGNINKILKQSLFMCILVSIIISTILYYLSDVFAIYIIKEERTLLSLKILTICFPFMSAGSCIRGYFFGLQNSIVPATSQIIEQIVRIIVVFLTAKKLVPMGLSYACISAILGIVIGEIISFIFVFIIYHKTKIKKNFSKKPSMNTLKIFITIISMTIPLSVGRFIGSLLSTIENLLIPQRLELFSNTGENAMKIYGSLTGLIMPLIQFPTAFLMAISITLVPAVSEAAAIKNKRQIKQAVNLSIFFTVIISLCFTSIFAIFSTEVCYIIYGEKNLDVLLLKLAAVCPFLYLQITLSGLLNGLGEHTYILKNNILSSVINISFIYFGIPIYGIDAFIFGWIISLILTSLISFKRVLKITKIKIDIKKCFLYPILCILLSSLTARLIFLKATKNIINAILIIILMCLFYMILLFITGCIKKDEIIEIIGIKRRYK